MNNVSERTIRTSISNLYSKGYIKVIIDRKEQNNSRRTSKLRKKRHAKPRRTRNKSIRKNQ